MKILRKTHFIISLSAFLFLSVFHSFAQEGDTSEPPPNCPVLEGEPDDIRTTYYMGEGIAFLDTGNFNRAELSFTCIIRVTDPSYIPAYMGRAMVYIRLRDYESAIADYSSAIERNPTLISAYNNRGVIYALVRDYEASAQDFDQVIELDADYISGYSNRAVIHTIAGEYGDAIAILEDAITRSGIDDVLAQYKDPERPRDAEPIPFDPLHARIFALLGLVYERQALTNFQNYLTLYNNSDQFPDQRIQSAAGALESRFTFELRLDDGSWMLLEEELSLGEDGS